MTTSPPVGPGSMTTSPPVGPADGASADSRPSSGPGSSGSGWPPADLLELRETTGRGRGLFASRPIPAGSPLLCEPVLASAPLHSDESEAWEMAAELCIVLLQRNLVDATAQLHPLPGSVEAAAEPERAMEPALCLLTAAQPAIGVAEAVRLLRVVALNAIELRSSSAGRRQALCLRGSMLNHSCSPNALTQAFTRPQREATEEPGAVEADGLCLCVRSVVAIDTGEEVCISYVADLAASFSERAAALRHHGFQPDRRRCDDVLERWLVSAEAKESKLKAIGALNLAADAAWQQAEAVWTDPPAARPLLMAAATHYSELLRQAADCLHHEHELCTHARSRLAHVMSISGAARSCANAVPLWNAVIGALRKCMPSAWPQLVPPLRIALKAARTADPDGVDARGFAEGLQRIDAVLRPLCDDVRDG